MTRAAIYARYSTDSQSDSSIEDQLRTCRERAAREGWTVVREYADRAVSGSSLMRVDIQDLILDARARKFDIVVAEALDRLSRDQEDIAHIYKRLDFEGIRIITLSEGEVGKLHIGLKGTMNAMFLDELARKTRRGLQGRVLAGKSGGGLSYGYNVVRRLDAAGEPVRGEREINETEAAIVRRIMQAYVTGKSPRKIAVELNKERIPGPSGRAWGATTINGHRSRGTGILNNELYIGKLAFGRRTFVKDPSTGSRAGRMNDPASVLKVDVPELRIVDQDLWDQVKAFQAGLERTYALSDKRRPPRLFSGLLKCGCCGGGMSIIAHGGRYGCSTARNKGTCDNRLTVRETEIEKRVVAALSTRLMDPALCETFCQEYTRHLNRLRMEHNATRVARAQELDRVEREIKKVIQSIKDGIDVSLIRDEANALQRRKEELTAALNATEDAPVLIHPNMAQRYKVQVQNLIGALHDPAHHDEAAQTLRQLIERIVFTPTEDKTALTIDLIGDLAGILQLTDQAGRKGGNRPADLSETQKAEIEQVKAVVGLVAKTKLPPASGGQVSMGAGAGFEPATFRL